MKNAGKITILFLFFVSLFASFFLNIEKIKVPHFGAIYKEVGVDLTLKNDTVPNILFNNKKTKNILKIDNGHYLIKPDRFAKINTITLDDTENIIKLMVYNGNDITFPEIQKELNINNSKDFISDFSIFILSFFYNPWFYIIPYILLFIYLVKYGFNCENNFFIPLIFILAFILRISSLNFVPFWDDEIYSIIITDYSSAFLDVFSDPGNPPLYFIYLKLFRLFFNNECFFRLSSVILGVLLNFLFYSLLKKTVSKKAAIAGLFLCSINIVLIYYSQELRSYILLMTFSVLNAIFLFNFKKNRKIYYFLSSLGLLLTHFYGSFLFLYNFAFGLFYLSKRRIKNFILVNIASFLIFVPILISKTDSIISDFNSWINIPDKASYLYLLRTFCGNITIKYHNIQLEENVLIFAIFIFAVIILYKCLEKRKVKIFLKYNIFSIIFVIFEAVIFSYAVKPVFFYKYFYVVFPMYLFIVSILISEVSKHKNTLIISFLMFFIFGINQSLNEQKLFLNHNLYLKFIKHEIDESKNNYIFMSHTVRGYKKFENMFKDTNAKLIYSRINSGINDINPLEEETKPPFVAYILNLYLKEDGIKKADRIDLYKTPVGVFLKAEYR